MEDLEVQMLKNRLSGDVLAAARSKFAEETVGMTIEQKESFVKGLKLALSMVQFGDLRLMAEMGSALLVAGVESLSA